MITRYYLKLVTSNDNELLFSKTGNDNGNAFLFLR